MQGNQRRWHQTGNNKTQALLNFPIPRDVKGVRQFMGLARFFRKFVPDFARRTSVITSLTKKDSPFQWKEEHEVARQYVINCLASRPLLSVFDPNLPTELHTDASSLGFGAILFQKLDGNLKVVGYYSRRTNPCEELYHSYELETLKHFRVHLSGVKFTLVMDCNAIKFTATGKKDLLPRVTRWWVYMQDFDFNIMYKKGSALPHVDYLSRNPVTVRRIENKS